MSGIWGRSRRSFLKVLGATVLLPLVSVVRSANAQEPSIAPLDPEFLGPFGPPPPPASTVPAVGAGPAAARGKGSEVVRATRDALGTTLLMRLAGAPFPSVGAPYTDASVWVFVPHYLRGQKDVDTPALVHFHGHNTTAERALTHHRLREQLVDSKQDAILIVPQGPTMASDSSAGKLEAEGGFRRLLEDVFAALQSRHARHALGRSRVSESVGRVFLSAHSGGYRAAAQCLRHGGVAVNEVYLFDALYADADVFRDWVIEGKGKRQRERHKLVSYVTPYGSTERWSDWLHSELSKAGVASLRERSEGTLSREDITRAEYISVRTSLAHSDVTNQWNQLRDCLFASAMPRHLKTGWFEAKHGHRPIDRER
jgi:hypothetical protein